MPRWLWKKEGWFQTRLNYSKDHYRPWGSLCQWTLSSYNAA